MITVFLLVMVGGVSGWGCGKDKQDQTETERINYSNINNSNNLVANFENNSPSENATLPKNQSQADWRLVSGDPADTCAMPTYQGEATLYGWYVYDYYYVEQDWLLEVAEEELNKVPLAEIVCGDGEDCLTFIKNSEYFKPQFLMIGLSEEEEMALKNASSEHPPPVTVRGFRFYCEGLPQLSVNGEF